MAQISDYRVSDSTTSGTAQQELEEHRRTFIGFERLVLFSVLHITLTLACLALAFIGNVKVLSFLIWSGGTLAMIAFFVVRGTSSSSSPTSSHLGG